MAGLADLLAHDPLPAHSAAAVAMLRQSAAALVRMLDDLLDTAREGAGWPLREATFALRENCELAVGLLGAGAHARGLALHCHVAPEVATHVRGDSLRLQQLLLNLVGNAIKFTERGEVGLRVDVVASDDGWQELAFVVRDSGIGIAPDALARLFRPYAQADAAHRAHGSGLGLVICRQLAQQMGGTLRLRSQPGVGTEATLQLRFRVMTTGDTSGVALQRAAVQRDLPAGPPRILVAEDDPAGRFLAGRQLALLGCVYDTVAHGTQALEAWERRDYALVITDCQMPGFDGYALARAIRETEAAQGRPRVPILGMTAHAGARERRLCREAGMDDCLHKPMTLGMLQAVVNWWAAPCLPSAAPGAPLPQALADTFAASLGESRAALERIAAQPDRAAMQALLHRLAGTGLVMPCPSLQDALHACRGHLARDGDVAVVQAARLLHARLGEILSDGVNQVPR